LHMFVCRGIMKYVDSGNVEMSVTFCFLLKVPLCYPS
jgi:hypothetical protein